MAQIGDSDEQKTKAGSPAGAPVTVQAQVKWDDSNMKSSYANICNVSSTREEVVLLFGLNQSWHPGQKELTVQLTDRIILSPFAAKRMSMVLNNLVREHEARFGPLNLEMAAPGDPAKR